MNLPGTDTGAFQTFYFGKVGGKESGNGVACLDNLAGCFRFSSTSWGSSRSWEGLLKPLRVLILVALVYISMYIVGHVEKVFHR